MFSTDDGYTWGSRTRVHTAADDHQLGAPQVINVGGTLVVSFMSDEAGNGPGADNGEMRVVTSSKCPRLLIPPAQLANDQKKPMEPQPGRKLLWSLASDLTGLGYIFWTTRTS